MAENTISNETLVAYAAREISEAEARSIEQQLEASGADVTKTVLKIRQLLAVMRTDDMRSPSRAAINGAVDLFNEHETRAPAAWLSNAFRAVAELLFDSRQNLAIAGFRGGAASAAGHHLSYRSGRTIIDLQIAAPAGPEDTHWKVNGQAEADDSLDDSWTSSAVLLCEADTGRVVDQAVPNDDGFFRLKANAGQYDLVIGTHAESIVVPQLQLGSNSG